LVQTVRMVQMVQEGQKGQRDQLEPMVLQARMAQLDHKEKLGSVL